MPQTGGQQAIGLLSLGHLRAQWNQRDFEIGVTEHLYCLRRATDRQIAGCLYRHKRPPRLMLDRRGTRPAWLPACGTLRSAGQLFDRYTFQRR